MPRITRSRSTSPDIKRHVEFGTFTVDATDTDEDLKRKAQDGLPEALRRVSEVYAEEEWKLAHEAGFDTTPASKQAYARTRGREIAREAGRNGLKQQVLDSIFEQLVELREKEKANPSE
jgi:hypothetical protein